MLPWTIVLALLGLILLFAEILMPGFGLFGILGGISLLAALVLTYRIYGLLAFLVMLAQTTLRPFGVADFGGKNFDVCSQGDFIDRGERVQVVQITGKTVTVRACGENQ